MHRSTGVGSGGYAGDLTPPTIYVGYIDNIKSNQIIYLWLKQSQDAKVWKKTLTDTFKN